MAQALSGHNSAPSLSLERLGALIPLFQHS